MASAFDRLAKEAMDLSPRQKLALAEILMASVDAEVDPSVQAEWDREIGDRIRAIESGAEEGFSYEDVMREAEARLWLRSSAD